MKRYLLGVLIVGLLSWWLGHRFTETLWWQTPLHTGDWVRYAALVVLLPVVVGWIVLEVTMWWRPRRHLLGRRRASVRLVGLGMIAAAMSVVTTAVIVALVPVVPDPAAQAITMVFAACLTMLVLPRHRVGHCVYCTYDLRGGTPLSSGRCTECGRVGDAQYLVRSMPGGKGRKVTA